MVWFMVKNHRPSNQVSTDTCHLEITKGETLPALKSASGSSIKPFRFKKLEKLLEETGGSILDGTWEEYWKEL